MAIGVSSLELLIQRRIGSPSTQEVWRPGSGVCRGYTDLFTHPIFSLSQSLLSHLGPSSTHFQHCLALLYVNIL